MARSLGAKPMWIPVDLEPREWGEPERVAFPAFSSPRPEQDGWKCRRTRDELKNEEGHLNWVRCVILYLSHVSRGRDQWNLSTGSGKFIFALVIRWNQTRGACTGVIR